MVAHLILALTFAFSPLISRATQGTPQGRQTGVAFFLVTFSLAKQEKVTDRTTSHLTNPAKDAG
jgi:hypothetical protein